MDWPIILLVIFGIFLFIKVIGKIIRIVIGVLVLVLIAYFALNIEMGMIMF